MGREPEVALEEATTGRRFAGEEPCAIGASVHPHEPADTSGG